MRLSAVVRGGASSAIGGQWVGRGKKRTSTDSLPRLNAFAGRVYGPSTPGADAMPSRSLVLPGLWGQPSQCVHLKT